MSANINGVEYYIEFDTRTGITVPADARATILAAAKLDPTLSQFHSWTEELLAPAHDSYRVKIGADGSTTLLDFRNPRVTASQLAMLETFIQHGGQGQNAVMYFKPGGGNGQMSLFECTGTGTAIRHESAIVFPTYAGSTPVPGAADVDTTLMEMQDALHTQRAATAGLPTAAERAAEAARVAGSDRPAAPEARPLGGDTVRLPSAVSAFVPGRGEGIGAER